MLESRRWVDQKDAQNKEKMSGPSVLHDFYSIFPMITYPSPSPSTSPCTHATCTHARPARQSPRCCVSRLLTAPPDMRPTAQSARGWIVPLCPAGSLTQAAGLFLSQVWRKYCGFRLDGKILTYITTHVLQFSTKCVNATEPFSCFSHRLSWEAIQRTPESQRVWLGGG